MSHPPRPSPAQFAADTGRFILEFGSLAGIGLIGWQLGNKGVLGAVLAVGIILIIGAVWDRFRTPGFVPTGREPVYPISGPKRIVLELGVYLFGIFGLWWSGRGQLAILILLVFFATLVLSPGRLRQLWSTRV